MNMQRLQRDPGNPSSVRPLLVVLSAVLMVIIGLLGMHTLSAGSASHGAGAGSHGAATLIEAPSSSGHSNIGAPGSAKLNSGACDDACQSSASQPVQHTDVMMACVLALIVGFIFLLPIAAMYRTRMHQGQSRFVLMQLRRLSLPPLPPSLIVLSISRT